MLEAAEPSDVFADPFVDDAAAGTTRLLPGQCWWCLTMAMRMPQVLADDRAGLEQAQRKPTGLRIETINSSRRR
jgi:hypothetical protein